MSLYEQTRKEMRNAGEGRRSVVALNMFLCALMMFNGYRSELISSVAEIARAVDDELEGR